MDRLDDAIELPRISRATSAALESQYKGPDGLPTSLEMKPTPSTGTSTRPSSTFADSDLAHLDSRGELNAQSLPPVDRGRAAWAFCAGACALEAMIWGWSLSFGTLQDHFTAPGGPFEHESPVAVSAVGTTALALEYSLLVVLIYVYRAFPRAIRPLTWAALALASGSLFASSFVNTVPALIVLQGVCFGVGAGVTYAPVIMYLSEWFSARRGLAGGIIFGGTGVAGAAIPLILGEALRAFGWRWSVRGYSVLMLLVCVPSLRYVKARLPIAAAGARQAQPLSYGFLRSRLFWPVAFTFFLQSLAYLPVSLYIPVFSTSLGQSPFTGQLALALFNLFAVVGQVGFGAATDRFPYLAVMALSALGSSIIAFCLWGFASTLAALMAFGILFGSLAGGFSSTCDVAARSGNAIEYTMIFASFALCKAVASIVGPLFAGSLRDETTVKSAYGAFGFARMTIFVGSAMMATTIGSVGSALIRRRLK